jgi:hypothetical protein
MELQAAATVQSGASLIESTVDVPTVILKDIRAEAAARITLSRPTTQMPSDEAIIPDHRAGVSPAQAVERKLSAMLRGEASIPVSHFRLARLCRRQ